MSTTIDERVVSMQFDNKKFESNVATSMSTLEKLKQSLNLTGAAKGLENVESAARKCNLAPLSSAVETVGLKFNAMYTIADQALRNITNSAMIAGKRILSALTIDPIKSGLSEYETQINAVQTILANTESKGTTLDDVNAALDTLNTYADKTIYNFTEMTRNIGTFTAAGVDLDTSVNAIQGIANLAAISGSNSQQASTAMYQLSQALSSGTVKLQDWNSVVNAGMGGQVFQDALKETARVHGIAIDDMIKEQGSFRETLSEGWLTSEILTETLMKFTMATEGLTEAQIEQNRAMLKSLGYSDEQIEGIFKLGDTATNAATKVKTFTQLMDTLKESLQSGWTQTWEILIGDFEQAKEMWTKVSDVLGGIISSSAEARNKVLRGAFSDSTWGEFSKKIEEAGLNMSDFEESVRKVAEEHGHDLDALIEKYGSFENAVKSGALSTDILKKSLDGLQKTGNSVDLSGVTRTLRRGESGEDVKKIEAALKALGYDLLGKDGKDYGHADDGYFGTLTEEAIKDFQKLNGLKVTGIVDEATLAALEEACNKTEKLDDSIYGLIDGFGNLGGRQRIIDGISNAFEGVKNVIAPITKAFREIFPPTTAEQLFSLVDGFAQLTEKFKIWTESAEGKEVIGDIASAFKGFFSIIDIGWTFVKDLAGGIFDLLGSVLSLGGGLAGAAGSLGEWITGLRNSIKEGDYFGKTIDAIVGFLKNVIDKIKSVTSFLGEKLVTPGWEAFVSVLSGVWDFIQKIGSKIAAVGSAIGGALGKAFRNGDIEAGLDIFNGGLLAAALIGLKKFFGSLEEAVGSGAGLLDGVKDILGSVGDTLKAWQQDLKAGILLKIAGAIALLAASVLILATIDPGRLAASLGAITVLFADLMLSMKLFSTFSKDTKGIARASVAMVAMSTAVLILASALKKIADLSWEELAKGLVGIAGLSAIMVLVAKALSKNSEETMKGTTQIVIFAAAIKILASVCKDLGSLSWEDLAKGLLGVSVLMFAMVKAVQSLGKSGDAKSVLKGAGQMILFAAALKIMASACKDLSGLSWEELGKGLLGVAGLTGMLVGATKILGKSGDAKSVLKGAGQMILFAGAMKIMASALKDVSGMSWEELGRGLLGMAGTLVMITAAVRFLPSGTDMLSTGGGLLMISAAMVILAKALSMIGGMSGESIAKGLIAIGGAIVILSFGLNMMNGAVSGSLALLAAAGAILVLAPALKLIGSMSWESIAKGLVAIAGAFAVIGVAGLLLTPVVPVILGLGAAFALIGVGVLALGVGLAALATGITALAVAGSAAGSAIAAFCRGITDSIVEIGNMLKALVLTIIDVLVESIPAIADGALKLIVGVLNALVEYTPQVVDGIMMFLISALDAVAARTPELVKSVLNVVTSLFTAVADAIMGLDGSTLAKAGIGVALMAALMALFNVLAPLIPGAIVGILGMGLVIAELALVLAAIGALSKIPGLTWLVGEGATLMENIGNAIGGFIGSVVGGIAEGLSSSLVQVGTDLSTFMTNLQPFLDGAASISQETLDGVGRLVELIMAISGASLLESITSWLTGESSMVTFAEQLVPFGTAIKTFADEISGVDEGAVTAAVNAGTALSEMAKAIPNTGGLVSFLTGDNDMATFGLQLVLFGAGLKNFAASVSGIDTAAITDAATASTSLVSLAENIPNTGGLVTFFTGTSDMATFGLQLALFGAGLKSFSDSVAGINTESISAVATASSSLVTLANDIPNVGGLVSFFTGTSDMATFGLQLPLFGAGLKSFADSIVGIDTEAISTVATASSSLVTLANDIPNTGGLVTYFTGTGDMATFGIQLALFGAGIKSFADSVSGIDTEAISAIATASSSLVTLANDIPNVGGLVSFFTGTGDMATFGLQLPLFGAGLKSFATSVSGIDAEALTAIATASTSLVTLANDIPNVGGLVSFFTGTSDMATFGLQLPLFGAGLKSFATSVSGIDAEALSAIATASTSLVTLANDIPNTGGLVTFFTGTSDMATFGLQIALFGSGLKSFAESVSGIDTEALSTVATASTSLVTLANDIPNTGGLVTYFTGTSDMATFGLQIALFGSGLKSFADSVSGIDTEAISSVATVSASLVTLANDIPSTGGLVTFFTGTSDMATFGLQLALFGDGLKSFSDSVSGINVEAVTAATNAGTALSTMANSIPESGGIFSWFSGDNDMGDFGTQIKKFGEGLSGFAEEVSGINSDSTTKAVNAARSLNRLADAITTSGNISKLPGYGGNIESFGKKIKAFYDKVKEINATKLSSITTSLTSLSSISTTGTSGLSSFVDSLGDVGSSGVDAFVKAFDGSASKIQSVGRKTLTSFMNGAKSEAARMSSAFKSLASNMANGMKGSYATFREVGKYLVKGFANGIALYTYVAKNASKKMAAASAKAAKDELKIHSPSKVGEEIGRFFGMGFVNEIAAYAGEAYDASAEMASYAREGLTKAISKVQSLLDSGLETQPTIRPVLDLSDIEAGAGAINGMFRMQPSVGVLSDIGTISYMMNKNQNGVTNSDVVSAIKDLGQKIGKPSGDTYHIDGITYDDGSNINDAVKTLVRAARVERRK